MISVIARLDAPNRHGAASLYIVMAADHSPGARSFCAGLWILPRRRLRVGPTGGADKIRDDSSLG